MILKKRVYRHILFWVVYFAVNLFNELFLSSSFTDNPSLHFIFLAVISQMLTLTIKIPLVYVVIDYMIPKWFLSPNKPKVIFQGVILFLMAMVMHRLIIQQIVWIYVYESVPPEFTFLQQTARLFYSLLDLLQVTGIAVAIKLFRMRISAIKKEKLLVKEKLQAEMLHLKSQINPHFLFNSLNTIFSLTRTKSDEAPSAVLLLSSILRHMIYETGKETISVGNELKIINDYIDLQKLRFGKKAQVKMEVNIEKDSAQIAPLLLMPLVENAFKHSIPNASDETGIFIKISQDNDNFSLIISNPAITSKADNNDEDGIGLANIKRQLEMQYRECNFTYGIEDGLFIVNLWINLKSYAGFELFDR
jgi:two-component system LytT family sensor kinase